ncbi:MAG: hypothetical protein KDJ86_06255 [Bauldia sp.]|uniref:hypothetical protein n=1 Tax=Bauldia sp. TaxID=2575872 RepID=UPI001DF1F6A4|nr:hypothetical protein [Bauldia sp.]MCB1495367.1 hypothetical protein [Bauldia sp.]
MNATSRRPIAAQDDPAGPAFPIADLLLESLQLLARGGQPEDACRLAGRGYALLRRSQPDVARRFDVFLHRLTPRLTWTEAPRRGEHITSRGPAITGTRLPSAFGKGEPDR